MSSISQNRAYRHPATDHDDVSSHPPLDIDVTEGFGNRTAHSPVRTTGSVKAVGKPMAKNGSSAPSTLELLDEVFRDDRVKHGLSFFRKGERNKLKLQRDDSGKIEIFCAKRTKWLRAKPEEVVRQLFLIY